MPKTSIPNGLKPKSPLGSQARARWKKGVSGNPGGMPKSVKILRDLIGERTNDGLELVEFALDVMRGTKPGMEAAMAREYAHAWLSDRYFGKPKQALDISGQATPQQLAALVALQLSPHERRNRIAELKERAIETTAVTNGHAPSDGDVDTD